MSIITLPPDFPVYTQTFGQRRFDLTFSGGDNGASQTKVVAPPRLTCTLASKDRMVRAGDAEVWRALVFALRGRINPLAVYDLLRPVPRGTARGAWTLAAPAAAGASLLTIALGAGQGGRTLLQGDWIGVRQADSDRQLLHVQATTVADGAGVIAVHIGDVLRTPLAAGSPVTWDRPTCLMRQANTDTSWKSQASAQGGFSIELLESWT